MSTGKFQSFNPISVARGALFDPIFSINHKEWPFLSMEIRWAEFGFKAEGTWLISLLGLASEMAVAKKKVVPKWQLG